MKELKDLNLIDDFLFQELLLREEGKEFCRLLLKNVLGKEIGEVKIIPQKTVAGAGPKKHGIRLDAYIEVAPGADNGAGDDVSNVEVQADIYDIEPNTYRTVSEARRTRYYHSLIDSKILRSGVSYEKLKNVIVIMILPYDPFGKNRMVYTFKKNCIEDRTIPYDDGSTTIYLYTKGKSDIAGNELSNMLKYIENSTEENAVNIGLKSINDAVNDIKHSEEVGVSYMKSWEYEQMWLNDGREAGRREGRREGREEGWYKSIITMICRKMSKGHSANEIADILEESVQMVQEICEIAKVYAPDYDVDKIYEGYMNGKN